MTTPETGKIVQPAAQPITQPPVENKKTVKLTVADTNPSNWGIEAVGKGGKVFAKNTVSGLTFEGTTKEFSKFIRGE
jgi:hypothetical protein